MSDIGTPKITRRWNLVETTPARTSMTIQLLASGDVQVTSTGHVFLGETADGILVYYRITGWDNETCSVLLDLAQPQPPAPVDGAES